jgi:hypothetical protein
MTRNAGALPLSVRLCTTIEGALVVPLPGIAYSRPSGQFDFPASRPPEGTPVLFSIVALVSWVDP